LSPLACPVRSCHQPLRRLARAWTCSNGHSFDVARSGYVNLLQPQDRRSLDAGDSAAAVDARSRLLASGHGTAIVDAFVSRAAALSPDTGDVVIDLGCGGGEVLGQLRARRPVDAIGIDLSVAAVNLAARRLPDATWVVANADRRLPLLDGSVSLVLSMHGRRNPSECRRVLRACGYLLIAVPAPDDLIELREATQGAGVERDRVADVVATHEDGFEVIDRFTARERRTLDATALRDALRGTYRGERISTATRVEALGRLDVTFASDVIVLRRR